jgi:hypothetical protein
MRKRWFLLGVLALAACKTQPITKVVAAKHEEFTQTGSEYWLIARDGTQCHVRLATYALTNVGDSIPCSWY